MAKRGPKPKLSPEQGAEQIMGIIASDTPVEPVDADSVRAAVENDVKLAADHMKSAIKHLGKLFAENRRAAALNGKLKERIKALEEENKKLRKWQKLADKMSQFMTEVSEDA